MPNRIIKDSIRTSKSVNALTDFQFRLWIYLITYVDDYGRGSADPEIIKGFVFPRRKSVTESSIKNELTNLAVNGLINLYDVDGESYFCFPNWSKHQRIQTKQSKYPAPEEGKYLISQNSTVGHGESPLESNTNPNTNTELFPPIPPKGAEEGDLNALFEDFWSAYPKKQGREEARKRFFRIKPSADLVKRMISAIELQKRSAQWQKEQGRFIPQPATWLSRGQWDDEVNAQSGIGLCNSFDTDDLFQDAIRASIGSLADTFGGGK